MSWTKKIIIIVSTIALIGVFDYWLWLPKRSPSSKSSDINQQQNQDIRQDIGNKDFRQESPINNSLPNNTPFKIQPAERLVGENFNLKSPVLLSVPFASQAPYANWDELHNEACEEAALIMAQAWLKDENLTPDKIEERILGAVVWQEKNWGGHFDLPAEKIVELARNYFQIEKIRVEYGVEIDDIKKELSKGNLVLVPAAGRILENPYYRQPGPYYHMLVVIGYNEKEIIANDPGTKRGKNFKYSYENFFKAIHDWPGPLGSAKDEVNILSGRKAMIVIEK